MLFEYFPALTSQHIAMWGAANQSMTGAAFGRHHHVENLWQPVLISTCQGLLISTCRGLLLSRDGLINLDALINLCRLHSRAKCSSPFAVVWGDIHICFCICVMLPLRIPCCSTPPFTRMPPAPPNAPLSPASFGVVRVIPRRLHCWKVWIWMWAILSDSVHT